MPTPLLGVNSTATLLLTLLNVSATRSDKRKQADEHVERPQKLNKRKTLRFDDSLKGESENVQAPEECPVDIPQTHTNGDADTDESGEIIDFYERQFGVNPVALNDATRNAADNGSWNTLGDKRGNLGSTADSVPEGVDALPHRPFRAFILDKLSAPLAYKQSGQTGEQNKFQHDLLSTLSTYQDLYYSRTSLEQHPLAKDVITLHALNHVKRKRRIILKNNERLASASKASGVTPADATSQDQGFTRPSVLFILPFRSSALSWLESLFAHTPSPAFQVENRARFLQEYSLPPGTVDKLATAEPGTYPLDHVAMFQGNIDESFRIGVKITKKSVKLFAEFYSCDIIVASPLGLKLSIENKNADFLSSIEILVVDQMDALTMQNWDHVKFVFSHLNKLPKESHDADFSRIKAWYLDGHSAYLRQSILLSAYETPEIRSLYNKSLKNVSGKIRTEHRWNPIGVPEGVQQDFLYFDSTNPKEEADRRFHHFTTQVLPIILKSAVQSINTVIFIPSSFDFVRVRNHFRKTSCVTFTVLSEESSNQDISRARQAFFSGKKAFLLVTERYHFYRRYKLRGIRNIIFYAPPDHAQFYTEFASFPFLDEGVESSDITCRVIYSKWDWFRLERIVGTERVSELIER